MANIYKVNNISELHQLMGQEKPLHPLVSVIDFAKVKTPKYGKQLAYSTEFYMITLKKILPGSVKYGRMNYDFQEGTLMFMGPNQVITVEDDSITEDNEGWGLFFHPDLIRNSTLINKMNQYSFFSYEANESLHLSDKEKVALSNIKDSIIHEVSQNIDDFSQEIIISNIELLLNNCKRFYVRQFITRKHENINLVVQFDKLIKGYFNSEIPKLKGLPSVKYCAEQLNLSPNYLGDLLKKETGKNAQEHIHYYLIDNAKNLLLSTTEAISEIAYNLGFEQPQSLNKIFKKNVGMSPTEYRNLN